MPDTSSEVIENFVTMYPPPTEKAYRIHVWNFFTAIGKEPETYFDGNPDVKHDLATFLKHLQDEGRPGTSIRTTLHAVKSFLVDYEHEPSRKTWKRLMRRIQGTRPATKTDVPKPHQLKEILEHGDLKARAFYLMLSSSGMRIGEALQLQLDDIDLKSEPTKIMLRSEYTKTSNPRITFISNEATEALKVWLRQRDDYLKRAAKKTNFKHKKELNDPRLFPFSDGMIRVAWNTMLKKAGYDDKDPTTGRRKITPHALRKYFRTYMSTEVSEDIVETLMGHEKQLRRIYAKHDDNYLAQEYRKGEQKIIVFQTPLDPNKINKKLNNVKLENYELRKDLNRVLDLLEQETQPKHGIPPFFRHPDGTWERATFNRELGGLQLTGDKYTEEEYNQLVTEAISSHQR